MYYFCTDPYKEIPLGAIVFVEFGIQVYIRATHIKKMYCTNEFILAMHFKKLGGNKNG